MNTFENMYTRKSCRTYTGENLTDEQLSLILNAAYAAPVGRAKYESLHLKVVQNADYLKRLDEAAAVAFGTPKAHPLFGAPTLIIISSNFPSSLAEQVNYSNAAILAEHISLAATELGIGSCLIWGAIRVLNNEPELLKELELEEGFMPCCSVVLGKTDEPFTMRKEPKGRIKTEYLK